MSEGVRKGLPSRRKSQTFKDKVRRSNVFVTVGYYEDGSPGEVFLDCMRTGSAMRTLLSAFAQTVSVALQCGTPVSELERSLSGLKESSEQGFDPGLVVAFMFRCLNEPLDLSPPRPADRPIEGSEPVED